MRFGEDIRKGLLAAKDGQVGISGNGVRVRETEAHGLRENG